MFKKKNIKLKLSLLDRGKICKHEIVDGDINAWYCKKCGMDGVGGKPITYYVGGKKRVNLIRS